MKFDRLRDSYLTRLRAAAPVAQGKFVAKENALALLQAVVRSGDRVCIEGDNQKQADFFARELVKLDPAQVNHLHMTQSTLVLNEHHDLFRLGIAERLDFAYSGPLTEICLLGNIAKRVDARILWDPAALKITNLPEANRFVRTDYRKGWSF